MECDVGFKWANTDPRLAIVCGTGYVYVWTPLGSAVTDLLSDTTSSTPLKANEVKWNVNGKHLMVSGKDASCVCQIN